ncbi:MAG TPA: 2-hydroxychromene-2-carboxylate isomerase [Burkholderiales bacterium]|jgi:2-hydroxychromene-2-carboxylate isomerase|nr:2-hydroxychromene-2-carboxylate isomerase [Burkholderiales bacterium]
MKTFEFWFDFGSVASYLAWTQLPALEAATGAKTVFKPMLLGGVFQATGNQSPAAIPAKGKYVFADFARFAKRYGVPFRMNPHFPINTLMLMRAAIALQMKGDPRFREYCNAMFNAIWADSLNMNDPATAADALRRAGFDAQALVALAGEQATKDALKAASQTAVDRGVFGAPTFFVGEQMFWGQDRMDFVKEALQ